MEDSMHAIPPLPTKGPHSRRPHPPPRGPSSQVFPADAEAAHDLRSSNVLPQDNGRTSASIAGSVHTPKTQQQQTPPLSPQMTSQQLPVPLPSGSAAPAAAAPSAAPSAISAPPSGNPPAAAASSNQAAAAAPGAAATTVIDEASLHTLPSGEVQRRAPVNPFHSPLMARFGIGKNRKRRRKVKDPKLLNNPLRGRLVVCISTTALLMWLFFWELLYNYTSFNGRCVSPVQYPDYKLEKEDDRAPMVIRYGYGACEYNLGSLSSPRAAVGSKASDKGYPTDLVKNGSIAASNASWDSPNSRILSVFGGLETNYIRNYHEVFRVFTSMYLHGGFLHICINLLCQIQSLWMLEPDWGFWRTALLFFIGGLSGNLLSAVADPCSITVGSSGAMYSLMGALIPYCVEYWKTIPRPCCILIFFIIVLLIGILTGMSGFTDNYAHIGGCIGGILFGFATITTVAACDKCTLGERLATTKPFSYCVPKETQIQLLERAKARKEEAMRRRRAEAMRKKKAGGARGKAIRAVKMQVAEQGRPPCKMAFREWVVRLACLSALIAYLVVLFVVLLDENVYKDYSPPGQLKFEGWLYCKCGVIQYEARQTTWNKGMYWCFGNEADANFYLNP